MNIQEQEHFERRAGRNNREALICPFGKKLLERIKELDGEDFTDKDFPEVTPWFLSIISQSLGYVRVKMKDERKGDGYWTWGYAIPQDKREEREIEKIKKEIPIIEAENETLRKQIEGVRR